MKRRFGVRARIVAVLAAGGLIAVASLLGVFRPLVLSNLEYRSGRGALETARVAAATVPADPEAWGLWARDLAGLLPDHAITLVRGDPGTPAFQRGCEAARVPHEEALTALVEGERLVARDGTIAALVRLQAPGGERALLAVTPARGAASGSAPVWSLWLWSVMLSFAVAGAGAYVVAYPLLVRPVAMAVAAARRATWTGPTAPGGDIAGLRDHLEALSRAEREANRKAERLAVEIRRMREDLKGAQATLLRAEKLASVGQLAAGIAHEIGNPIGIILGLADLLKDGVVSADESRRFAGQIREAAGRVDAIIRDLLQFARPIRDEEARADVREVLEATVQLLRPQKRFKEVEVRTDLAEGPLWAEIRASQLQQVLVNLLLNAADAMKGRGRVTVRAWRRERDVFLEVEDEGTGIPPGDRERVFDPFYTTKAPGEGTGLGLPICAQIVEIYGGDISVERAREGRGACFRVRLWQAG